MWVTSELVSAVSQIQLKVGKACFGSWFPGVSFHHGGEGTYVDTGAWIIDSQYGEPEHRERLQPSKA